MNLLNNSNEMKTVVETFVIEETAELIYDNDKLDKWNELVTELGLEGQTRIVAKEKSPIPFMHLKRSMVNVFKCLCPKRVEVKNYNVSPIPVEILDLVALALRESHFDKIEIWYDDVNPDPACIGIKYDTWYGHKDDGGLEGTFKNKSDAQKHMNEMGWTKRTPYPSDETFYLLGKWADVKHSFDELKEMATKRFIASAEHALKQKIKEAERNLSDLQSEAFGRFEKGEIKFGFDF